MVRLRHIIRIGQLIERNPILSHPGPIGLATHDLGLYFLVIDDAALHGIDHEHPARHEAALLPDLPDIHRQHASLRSQNHQAIRRHLIATGTQPVAVERRADELPIGETDRRRAIPGFLHRRVILVESSPIEIHLRIGDPGLRNQHHHGVRKRAASHGQEFHRIVQTRRVALFLGDDRIELVRSWPNNSELSRPCRARIQLTLPLSVLISPLWQM